MDELEEFRELVAVIRRLRAPDGCDWDRAQTPQSLCKYLLEEAYELVDAIENDGAEHVAEELGDLLMHILLQAVIGEEQGAFTLGQVLRGIREKLVRRHPHVFGETRLSGPEAVVRQWQEIKRTEREDASILSVVPRALPALQRAQRLQREAARVGFDWERVDQVVDKVQEELAELLETRREGDQQALRHEAGDLLFAVVNLVRALGADAEEALRETNERFVRRFSHIEQVAARRKGGLDSMNLEEMDRLWEDAKRIETADEPRPPDAEP
jgi:tetrapyrrole methylase family protein/MazG family protein